MKTGSRPHLIKLSNHFPHAPASWSFASTESLNIVSLAIPSNCFLWAFVRSIRICFHCAGVGFGRGVLSLMVDAELRLSSQVKQGVGPDSAEAAASKPKKVCPLCPDEAADKRKTTTV
jgi:hypothetical protein